jgi:hypothetical protein
MFGGSLSLKNIQSKSFRLRNLDNGIQQPSAQPFYGAVGLSQKGLPTLEISRGCCSGKERTIDFINQARKEVSH